MTRKSEIQPVRQERPRFPTTDASRIARELYDLSGHLSELPSERDQNFHLIATDGLEYTLKIANSGEDRLILDFQNEAMFRVGAAQVFPTNAGQLIGSADGHFVRLVAFLPGIPLADYRPHRPELLREVGSLLGRVDHALAEFSHPAADRDLYWNIANADRILSTYKHLIDDPGRRQLVDRFSASWTEHAVPDLPSLRTSVIHGDANDHNLIVGDDGKVGIIDFGDMVRSYTVAEVAVAAAYVMLSKPDPLTAAAHVVGGYFDAYNLTESDLRVLFHFICRRLCMSVTIAAHQKQLEPYNEYLKVSEQPAWTLLEKLSGVNHRLAHYTFRDACRIEACPTSRACSDHLRTLQFAPIVAADLKSSDVHVLDFSIASPLLGTPDEIADTAAMTERMSALIKSKGARVGVGRYDEARGVYTSDLFKSEGNDGPEWRTVHLGIDLFMEAGAPVFAPLEGVIHGVRNNTALLDYGPTIVLEHRTPDGGFFYTLYGHLSPDSIDSLRPGMPVKKGERIAGIGNFPENGGWVPHVHFQVIMDMLDRDGEFPGVAAPGKRGIWLSLSPDPNLILGIPAVRFPEPEPSSGQTLEMRRRYVAPSLALSYKTPLKIVRGYKQYLYDETGRGYLDCVNNVAHVGHCHPRVVKAGHLQMAVLNTNTRYLHDNIVRYARRLCEKLPARLSVCLFVNSGSEANDLALRLARAHTKTMNTIVIEGAYHGNLTSLLDISPYKFEGPGGSGAPAHVRKVSLRHEDIKRVLRGPATFIAESILSCAGQVVLPENYLGNAYRLVREAGGVCIADEVQVGFGRVGSHFWGFETQGVAPDIVTMGKPIGNGHPIGAVVTTPAIAQSFNNGMEYFNTYGGNPVSCAIGLSVLDVIMEEKLQANAFQTGMHLRRGLDQLAAKHRQISEVRGLGLFIGVEFARPEHALYTVERMKERGILLSVDGPLHNVIKIKPPLVFSQRDADVLVATLGSVLEESPLILKEGWPRLQ